MPVRCEVRRSVPESEAGRAKAQAAMRPRIRHRGWLHRPCVRDEIGDGQPLGRPGTTRRQLVEPEVPRPSTSIPRGRIRGGGRRIWRPPRSALRDVHHCGVAGTRRVDRPTVGREHEANGRGERTSLDSGKGRRRGTRDSRQSLQCNHCNDEDKGGVTSSFMILGNHRRTHDPTNQTRQTQSDPFGIDFTTVVLEIRDRSRNRRSNYLVFGSSACSSTSRDMVSSSPPRSALSWRPTRASLGLRSL